jgi:phage baseplate assembly protein W
MEARAMGMEFVGHGIAFPMRTDAVGGVALVTQEREIEEAIRIILSTSPGERPMRPDFGCRIAEYVFSPANTETAGKLAYEVRVALQRWEPRIDLDDVRVGFDAVDTGRLFLDISYRIRSTNDPRNLVFPFYVIPPHQPATGSSSLTAAAPPALVAPAKGF